MADFYKKHKLDFDRKVYAYLVKRLREPVENSDSAMIGAVDGFGAPVKEGLRAFWAYTPLDRLIFDLRAALGDRVSNVPADYDDCDALSLMCQVSDPKRFHEKYDGPVSMVEECEYLPPETRGGEEPFMDEESDMSFPERVSRALTVATFLLYSLKLGELPNDTEFDTVLEATEETFNVRSIGTRDEIEKILREGGLSNGPELTNDGYILLVRLAKWIVGHELCAKNSDPNHLSADWRKLSRVG